MPTLPFDRARLGAVALFLLLALAGCDSAPKTYPVEGKVELPAPALKKLVDKEATVYFQLESDPKIQASGKLEADGTFKLSTTHKGKTLTGAQEGTYKVCLLWDDHPEAEQKEDDGPTIDPPLSKTIIPYRYLTFNRSGWKATVPTSEPVVLKVAAK